MDLEKLSLLNIVAAAIHIRDTWHSLNHKAIYVPVTYISFFITFEQFIQIYHI